MRINKWLHLWLGLSSGIIVFIVCITGCIWVFHEEITALLEPRTRIERQGRSVIPPSQLMQIASELYPDKQLRSANYQQGRTVNLGISDKNETSRRAETITLKINPYTGEVVSKEIRQEGRTDFFRFILNGHRFLWLPYKIGRPVVNYATLVFVILLITGLIWWYPKKWNRSTRNKSFKVKWGASYKRLNLDLHNVLGFYSLLFLAAIALTGMVWGIKWYSEGLYWVTSAGKPLPEYTKAESDSLRQNTLYRPHQAMDIAWQQAIKQYPKAEGFYYTFPDPNQPKSVIYVYIYPNSGQFYNSRSFAFDQHTLKELKQGGLNETDYAEASFASKLRRMNYDIHVGSILGFPGKVLAFLFTLIGASLPITGFLIWWWRKKGFRKAKKNWKTD